MYRSALHSRFLVTTFIIFFVFLIATFIAFGITSDAVKSETGSIFSQQANLIEKSIENKLNHYATILYGIAGFFEGSEGIAADEWSSYVQRLDLKDRYPGINSVAFANRIEEEGRDKYVVTYVEPAERTAALGFDIASEETRLKALERSLQTGHIAVTDKILLAADQKLGFLMFLPVFKNGERLQVEGIGILTFNSDLVFKNVYGKGDPFPNLSFKLYNGREVSEEALLYDHEPGNSISEDGYSPKFKTSATFTINGETLTLTIASKQGFELTPAQERLPQIVLISGLAFSFLFLGIFIYKLKQHSVTHKGPKI